MTLLLIGQLLEVATVSITVLVLTMLLKYGKYKYIKDLQVAFSSYLLLIVISLIPVNANYLYISYVYKYFLLGLVILLLCKIIINQNSPKHKYRLYLLIITFLLLSFTLLIIIQSAHLLEGIGYLYLGLTFIMIGYMWLKSILTHLSASKLVGRTFIIFGLHLIAFLILQFNSFLFDIGYIIASGFEVLITYGLILLNFENLKEIDDLNHLRYTNLFNNSSDAIFLIKDDTIFECNQKCIDLFKYPREAFIGKTPMYFSEPIQENGRQSQDYGDELFSRAKKGEVTLFDWIHRSSEGKKINCQISLFSIGPDQFAAIIRDMTYKSTYEEELNFHKYYDALTHLPNRELFIDRLGRYLDDQFKKVALIAFNIDDFKSINDQFGHETGDLLLQEVTNRICHAFSHEITLTRLGGDQFVLILNRLDNTNLIYKPITRIQKAFKNTFYINGHELNISACLGVAFPENNLSQPMDLLKHVDLALNIAKGKGKGKLEFFSKEQQDIIVNRITLEKQMRKAISNGEFIPYYQPIIDSQTNRIVGVEALARWQTSDGTMIYPDVFIPIAEETELIKDIGSSILRKACQQCSPLFRQHSDFILHVNLSPLQLHNKAIVKELRRVMEDFEITSRHLAIELTESIFIEDPQRTNNLLKEIRKLGVGVALDDFGTGFSSLAYLLEMQIDTIKIDRAFVIKLPQDEKAKALFEYTSKLAGDLGYSIIVEGVEEKDQADYISSLGCNYIQGYYYYRPMTYDKLKELMDLVDQL